MIVKMMTTLKVMMIKHIASIMVYLGYRCIFIKVTLQKQRVNLSECCLEAFPGCACTK